MCKGPEVGGSKVHLGSRKRRLVAGPQGATGKFRDKAGEVQRALGLCGGFLDRAGVGGKQ